MMRCGVCAGSLQKHTEMTPVTKETDLLHHLWEELLLHCECWCLLLMSDLDADQTRDRYAQLAQEDTAPRGPVPQVVAHMRCLSCDLGPFFKKP